VRRNYKIERLENGETFTTKERGSSMVPLIHSNQEHVLAPLELSNAKVGDIVYCKVRGGLYTNYHTLPSSCAPPFFHRWKLYSKLSLFFWLM